MRAPTAAPRRWPAALLLALGTAPANGGGSGQVGCSWDHESWKECYDGLQRDLERHALGLQQRLESGALGLQDKLAGAQAGLACDVERLQQTLASGAERLQQGLSWLGGQFAQELEYWDTKVKGSVQSLTSYLAGEGRADEVEYWRRIAVRMLEEVEMHQRMDKWIGKERSCTTQLARERESAERCADVLRQERSCAALAVVILGAVALCLLPALTPVQRCFRRRARHLELLRAAAARTAGLRRALADAQEEVQRLREEAGSKDYGALDLQRELRRELDVVALAEVAKNDEVGTEFSFGVHDEPQGGEVVLRTLKIHCPGVTIEDVNVEAIFNGCVVTVCRRATSSGADLSTWSRRFQFQASEGLFSLVDERARLEQGFLHLVFRGSQLLPYRGLHFPQHFSLEGADARSDSWPCDLSDPGDGPSEVADDPLWMWLEGDSPDAPHSGGREASARPGPP